MLRRPHTRAPATRQLPIRRPAMAARRRRPAAHRPTARPALQVRRRAPDMLPTAKRLLRLSGPRFDRCIDTVGRLDLQQQFLRRKLEQRQYLYAGGTSPASTSPASTAPASTAPATSGSSYTGGGSVYGSSSSNSAYSGSSQNTSPTTPSGSTPPTSMYGSSASATPSTSSAAPSSAAWSPAGGTVPPATANSVAPASDTPGQSSYTPGQSSYTPGQTGYNPPNSAYAPSSSPGAPASGAAPAHGGYHPGGTSDYNPAGASSQLPPGRAGSVFGLRQPAAVVELRQSVGQRRWFGVGRRRRDQRWLRPLMARCRRVRFPLLCQENLPKPKGSSPWAFSSANSRQIACLLSGPFPPLSKPRRGG